MTPDPNSPFIVAGMHRSGTSLAASILLSGGVDMGERLMPGDHGNVRGHFENEDFVAFHRDLLRSQGKPEAGWVTKGLLEVDPDFAQRGRALLDNAALRTGPAGWGWKDPRTTLFLPFWHALAPGAVFIFLYRAPWEVADSIYRRGSEQDLFFRDNPSQVIAGWQHYNRLVLDFRRQHPSRCLLVSNDALLAEPQEFTRQVNGHFGSNISPPPPDAVAADLMHRQSSGSTRPQMVADAFPECVDLLQELQAASALPSNNLATTKLLKPTGTRNFADAFQDWFFRYQLPREARLQQDLLQGELATARQWHGEQDAALQAAVRAHESDRQALEESHAADREWHREKIVNMESTLADTRQAFQENDARYQADRLAHQEKIRGLESQLKDAAALLKETQGLHQTERIWLQEKINQLESTLKDNQTLIAEHRFRYEAERNWLQKKVAQLEATLQESEQLIAENQARHEAERGWFREKIAQLEAALKSAEILYQESQARHDADRGWHEEKIAALQSSLQYAENLAKQHSLPASEAPMP